MAKSTKDKDVVSEATDAVNAAASRTAKAAEATKADEPKRFTITRADGTKSQTDNCNVAFSSRGEGVKVIDHANDDREYDGKNPSKAKG